jgi:hypothetical protein
MRSMPSEELGSLGSWVRDAVLAGALMPAGALATVAVAYAQRDLLSPLFLDVLVTAVIVGGVLGALLGAPACLAARLVWRSGALPAFALGPAMGALGAPVALWGTELAMAGSSSTGALLAMAAFGAISFGPPWAAYLSVRSRGRSGLGVVLGAGLWAAGCALLLLGWAELRELW